MREAAHKPGFSVPERREEMGSIMKTFDKDVNTGLRVRDFSCYLPWCFRELQYSQQTPCKAIIMTVDRLESKTHYNNIYITHFLLLDWLSLFMFVYLSRVSASKSLLFSLLSRCLCSHRSWQTFWRSVTWCSQACSVWRCCWSSWLWGSLATSKTPIMASTASLSSSGEVLLPSALRCEQNPPPGLLLLSDSF